MTIKITEKPSREDINRLYAFIRENEIDVDSNKVRALQRREIGWNAFIKTCLEIGYEGSMTLFNNKTNEIGNQKNKQATF